MDSLPTIPTPASQLWREIRIRILPVVTFVTVIGSLFLMWREYVMPASIIGEAEVLQANIVAKEDGVLSSLTVDRFDTVTRDQVIGVITPMDKDLQDASLAAMEAGVRVQKRLMDIDSLRNKDSYIQLRAAIMAEHELLADLKTRFIQAEFDFQNKQKLYNEGNSNMISLAELEIARRDRDSYVVRIDKKNEIISQYQKDIEDVEKHGIAQIPEKEPSIENEFEAKKRELLELTKPVDLKVPIDGKVCTILKHAGERVTKGEAIMTVSSPSTDRVIGYIRQPINRLPTTNDTAQIRTRTQRRVVVEGHIVHVGPSMIPLEPAILAPDVRRREVGLPILITLPQGSPPLVPGEFVDISIQYAKK